MTANLVNPRRLSEQTGWPESRIRKLVSENALRHIRVGRNILIPQDAIDEYLRINIVAPKEPPQ